MAASQIIYAETTFLEGCIDGKKRTDLDCYEALGLYSETIDKDPKFYNDEANQLHKRIKEIAIAFEAAHRDGRKPVKEILIEDGTFANETRRLGEIYGAKLWGEDAERPPSYGRQHGANLSVPKWDKKADRDNILYLIRCWITWHVVQFNFTRGKQRAKTAVIDLSDDSDDEIPHTPPRDEATASSILPFRAPTAPSMAATTNHLGSGHVTTVAASAGRGITGRNVTSPRSPVTPTKRKAHGVQRQTSSGKLQKVNKDIHASGGKRKARQEDVYAGPPSPTPAPPVPNWRQNRGGGASDTDSLYAPPREATIESETVFDPDEIMQDLGELREIAQPPNKQVTHPRSPSAGPSGTYRNPHRQDSVGPSTQDTPYPLTNIVDLDPDPAPRTPRQHHQVYISHLSPHQLRTLRNELFTLLLSFLNHINDFHPACYDPAAEARLDHLLVQFWLHDAEQLGTRVGVRSARMQDTWHRWLAMRQALSTFQQATGYFGAPGEEWKAHLRGMDRVAHARASIAYVELRNVGVGSGNGEEEEERERGSTDDFDGELMEVFDVLTDVEGCTGVEEFEAVRAFNEELRGWFE